MLTEMCLYELKHCKLSCQVHKICSSAQFISGQYHLHMQHFMQDTKNDRFSAYIIKLTILKFNEGYMTPI